MNLDEAKLGPAERLALAAYRMNCWQWDDMFGEKPDGFDRMTIDEKNKFIHPQFMQIDELLGDVYLGRCFWIFDGKTEAEWLEWRKSRLAYEKEYKRHEDAQRSEKDGKKLQTKIPFILAFCTGVCLSLLLLLVFKALHGGFAA